MSVGNFPNAGLDRDYWLGYVVSRGERDTMPRREALQNISVLVWFRLHCICLMRGRPRGDASSFSPVFWVASATRVVMML